MADEWDEFESPGIAMGQNKNFGGYNDGDSGKPESSDCPTEDFQRSNDDNNYNRNGKDGGFNRRGGSGGRGGGGGGYGSRNDRGGGRGGGGRGGYNNDRNNRRSQFDDAEENGEDNGNEYSSSNNGNSERGDYRRGGDRNDGNDGDNRRGRGGGGRGGGGRGGGGRRNFDSEDQDDGGKPEGEAGGTDTFNSEKPKEFYIPPEPTEDENEIFGNNISTGINFEKFNEIPINVSGENIPKAIENFSESGLREFLIENVQKSKYTTPTPIQKHAIPVVLNGRDLMACAQTGSGKTAAFLLPIIDRLLGDNTELSIGKPQAVIVSPTRELTIQIYNEARKFSMGSFLKCCIVYGGTATRHQSGNVAKGCHLLIATPGRLLDFVDKAFISFEDVKFVVLDEADRMLDMGFIPSMEKMFNHPTMPAQTDRQTLMFSATFPDEIQRLAGQFLNNYIFVAIGIVGSACADVEQKFFQVAKFEKRKKLLDILNDTDPSGTLVFVETKRNADFLAALLSETEIPTTSIHGDRLQREREEALRDFKSQKMKVLIATSVAARGLDIKNVEHVVNYDMPKSIDDYVHRIGRTGRVGNRGRATALFDSEQDASLIGDLVKILKQANQEVPDFLNNPGSGGGGGGFGGNRNNFGSKDVRKGVNQNNNRIETSQPLPDEPEDDW